MKLRFIYKQTRVLQLDTQKLIAEAKKHEFNLPGEGSLFAKLTKMLVSRPSIEKEQTFESSYSGENIILVQDNSLILVSNGNVAVIYEFIGATLLTAKFKDLSDNTIYLGTSSGLYELSLEQGFSLSSKLNLTNITSIYTDSKRKYLACLHNSGKSLSVYTSEFDLIYSKNTYLSKISGFFIGSTAKIAALTIGNEVIFIDLVTLDTKNIRNFDGDIKVRK